MDSTWLPHYLTIAYKRSDRGDSLRTRNAPAVIRLPPVGRRGKPEHTRKSWIRLQPGENPDSLTRSRYPIYRGQSECWVTTSNSYNWCILSPQQRERDS